MNPKSIQLAMSEYCKVLSKDSTERHLGMVARLVSNGELEHGASDRIRELCNSRAIPELLEYVDTMANMPYANSRSHSASVQVAYLIKKYPWLPSESGLDPERAARRSFLLAERRCGLTNRRLRSHQVNLDTLSRMRSFIVRVLGEVPDLEAIFGKCDFSGGASMGVHGNRTNVARKLASRWSVTPRAKSLAFAAVTRNFQLLELLLEKRNGYYCFGDVVGVQERFAHKVREVTRSKVAYVPKTAKTHRTIAVEPTLNGFLQKGIDLYMREKLRHAGLDLANQSINQELARQGSLPGQVDPLSTLDLSSASDSVSLELVRELLPPDWLRLLESCRTPGYELDGKGHTFRKFCSMGNGFCFPLETLIFAAAVKAAGARRVNVDWRVYGDDIIVRQSIYDTVVDILRDIGFVLNKDKSFKEGPFRESCGADWFNGEDVRPYVLDERLDSFQAIAKFLNFTSSKPHLHAFFLEERERLLQSVPTVLQFYRPQGAEGEPDGSIEVPFDLFMSSPYATWSRDLWAWGGRRLIYEAVSDATLDIGAHTRALAYAALRGSSSRMPFTVRRKTRLKIARSYFSQRRLSSLG